jgi:hypothetical protein
MLRRKRTISSSEHRHPPVQRADFCSRSIVKGILANLRIGRMPPYSRKAPQGRVDTAAVGKARIDPGLRFIDPASDAADDLRITRMR